MGASFASTSDWLAGSVAPVTGTGARTVAFHIKTSTTSDQAFFGWGGTAGGSYYRVRMQSSTPRLEHGSGYWRGNTTFNDGGWHGFSVSNPASDDLSGTVMYVDGSSISVLASSTGTAINTSSTAIEINHEPGGRAGVVGDYAEFAVWNVELTAAEHAAVTQWASPLLVRPNALVYYVPFVRSYTIERMSADGISVGGGSAPSASAHPSMFYPARPHIVTAPAAAAGGALIDTGLQGGMSFLNGGIRG